MYKFIIRPILFLIDPEKVHHLSFKILRFLFYIPGVKALTKLINKYDHPALEKEVFGIKFKNPVGLAAGFDKDAKLIDQLDALGFGFVEIGTVTPKPQEGNPKPRLFRLPQDKAIINRMGFNNDGVDAAVQRLQKRKSNLIIGGNIGKNKVTPNDQATSDYIKCYEALKDHVDYFTLNVSSPNTPGLRELQEKEPLTKLIKTIQELNNKAEKPKPILLKIAPDLEDYELDDIIDIIQETKLDGVIATNTTVNRDNLMTHWEKVNKIGAGGLSGKPLTERSNQVIKYIAKKSNHQFPIIAVGGIMTPEEAIDKLDAGATLVQIYTGFIYEGPSLIKKINKAIVNL